MEHMTFKDYWKTILQNFPSTYAVTLAYNPHCRGSHAAVYRVKAQTSFGGTNTVTIAYDSSASHVRLPTRVDACNRLTTVRHVTPDQVRHDVALLSRNVDRRLLGRLFNRQPAAMWSAYIGFIEHPDSNTHVHLAWHCHDPHGLAGAELAKQWGKLSPYFTSVIRPLSDPVEWANYMLKDQSPAALLDSRGLILSRAH